MSDISAKEIDVSYDDKHNILEQLSLSLHPQKITTIIGANGCGKSTLLKALTRIHSLKSGQVLIDGQDITTISTKEVARKITLLPQILEATEGISVYELISYGRFPHQKYFGSLTENDKKHIDWAMEATQTSDLAHLDINSLSGGQRQRVWIAMALAQDTPTIFLDEPTTYLDMNHQLEILELLKDLNHNNKKTIILILHDLNLSARFSDYLIAMKDGAIKYHDTVDKIMTPNILKEIFNIEAHIVEDPIYHTPTLLTYQLV